MKKVLLLVLVLMMSFPVWARKPAVDPIMGISIDNEPQVKEPSLSKGFQFSSYQEIKRSPQSIGTGPETKVLPTQSDKVTPLFFMLLMLILPVGLWFGIMKNIKGPGDEELTDKVREIKKRKPEDKDDDFKKAS